MYSGHTHSILTSYCIDNVHLSLMCGSAHLLLQPPPTLTIVQSLHSLHYNIFIFIYAHLWWTVTKLKTFLLVRQIEI